VKVEIVTELAWLLWLLARYGAVNRSGTSDNCSTGSYILEIGLMKARNIMCTLAIINQLGIQRSPRK